MYVCLCERMHGCMCVHRDHTSWVSSLIILHLEFLCFGDTVALCSSAWPRISYTDHAVFELRKLRLPPTQSHAGITDVYHHATGSH